VVRIAKRLLNAWAPKGNFSSVAGGCVQLFDVERLKNKRFSHVGMHIVVHIENEHLDMPKLSNQITDQNTSHACTEHAPRCDAMLR